MSKNSSSARSSSNSVPQKIDTCLLFGSDNLETVLLSELEEMAAQNILVKKCAYCSSYFIPFSSKTVYCDRLVRETGKTCKEIAVKEKYEKKIASDQGLTLYRQRNRAYAMRVSRQPKSYPDSDYQAWKAAATAALKLYEDGALTSEAFDAMTILPSRK